MAGTEDTSRRRPVSHEARAVLLLAVMGSILIGFGAYQNAFVPGVHPANIVHPGADGPSASAILSDFPDHPLPPGLGHDGPMTWLDGIRGVKDVNAPLGTAGTQFPVVAGKLYVSVTDHASRCRAISARNPAA